MGSNQHPIDCALEDAQRALTVRIYARPLQAAIEQSDVQRRRRRWGGKERDWELASYLTTDNMSKLEE